MEGTNQTVNDKTRKTEKEEGVGNGKESDYTDRTRITRSYSLLQTGCFWELLRC